MKPYYEHAGITIYHGDCRELLNDLLMDVVLTDPPYGIGVEYGQFKDTPANVQDLIRVALPVCRVKARVTALTCATRQCCWYPEPSWILCWLNRAGSYCNPWGFTCWQPILVYGRDPYLEAGLGSRPDVIEHSETAEPTGHPVPKPIGFWSKLLKRVSLSRMDVICDPFMGSGTTLVAAKANYRRAIGIEIEERYCEIAAKRLTQEVLPLELETAGMIESP